MKHEVPFFRESPSSGGITTPNTTTAETSSIFGWGWPDEARLADFVEQDDRAEKDDRLEQTDRTMEQNTEYAALYFVS